MTERDCNACLWARRDGDCASWDCDYIPMAEAAEAWKEAKASEMTEEETKALNDLYARAFGFWCNECRGYGDDYYFDEDGELVSACETCPIWMTYGEEDERPY